MNNASPFYIYISNTPVTKSGTIVSSSSKASSSSYKKKTSSDKDEKGSFISKYIITRVSESVLHTLETSISDSVKSIGYLQGNYVLESNVEQELAIGKKIANTAITAGVAVVTGHYVVAAIDVAVSIVNSAISNSFNAKQNNAIIASENFTATQLSIRAGLSSSRDGSRGTEN
jgi:hypothetical protein